MDEFVTHRKKRVLPQYPGPGSMVYYHDTDEKTADANIPPVGLTTKNDLCSIYY